MQSSIFLLDKTTEFLHSLLSSMSQFIVSKRHVLRTYYLNTTQLPISLTYNTGLDTQAFAFIKGKPSCSLVFLDELGRELLIGW